MASYGDKHNITHNQRKHPIFSSPFLLILPEKDSIGKTETKILLKKTIYDTAKCARSGKQFIKSNMAAGFYV